MSIFNEEQFKEGLVSELALFDSQATQTSVSDIYCEEVRPLYQVLDDSPFVFILRTLTSIVIYRILNYMLNSKLKNWMAVH